jgi:hypothetical protein
MLEEQRRTLDALQKKPAFVIGFDVGEGRKADSLKPEIETPVIWVDGQEMSEPFKVMIVARNNGLGTARDCRVSYRWPGAADISLSGLITLQDGEDRIANSSLLVVHPETNLIGETTVKLPRHVGIGDTVEIQVRISMSEFDPVSKKLLIRRAPDSAVPSARLSSQHWS